ncbi:DUF6538 domain-containing protein [Desulfopila sp. IMCC35008]|uniref:DUF6538 domain-containing protein n=1 Tax=Desulfopila sp. IMCC35008 TaxID=2653858 RepID=UPI0013D6C43F|nr:DUF6538 domain-containing protein [Desulfopila sp. IMCC35008]
MRVSSYCFQSKGLHPVYYFRMRIPKELQSVLKRTELKKSVRTNNRASAIRLSRQYAAAADKHFAELRLKLFQASMSSKNNLVATMLLPNMPVATSTPPRVEQDEIMMSRLIELYVKEETSKREWDIAVGLQKNLLRFMEIVGDKPMSQYTVEDRQKYRDTLLSLGEWILDITTVESNLILRSFSNFFSSA